MRFCALATVAVLSACAPDPFCTQAAPDEAFGDLTLINFDREHPTTTLRVSNLAASLKQSVPRFLTLRGNTCRCSDRCMVLHVEVFGDYRKPFEAGDSFRIRTNFEVYNEGDLPISEGDVIVGDGVKSSSCNRCTDPGNWTLRSTTLRIVRMDESKMVVEIDEADAVPLSAGKDEPKVPAAFRFSLHAEFPTPAPQ